MLATNVSNYNVQKYKRWILAIIIFRNAGDKFYQFDIPEMLVTNVSIYLFFENGEECYQLSFSGMLAIIISRNAGDKC